MAATAVTPQENQGAPNQIEALRSMVILATSANDAVPDEAKVLEAADLLGFKPSRKVVDEILRAANKTLDRLRADAG